MVLRQNAGEFSANLIGLMKTFAHQAVLAMRNARLFTEVDHKSRELLAANDIVREQADKLQEQTDQLKDWNRSLEERVETQLGEIERIRRLERFLAPQVAQLIASSDGHEGLLDSHRREVTVVFCDLRGFTAFTETTEPEEAMNVLREYHAALGELIFKYEGTLDRYAGDGVMILFNAPIQFDDHTARAVRMAVEMRDTIGGLTDKWRNRGHNLGFGIGIALGYATLGQIGFEQRLEYAAIGSVTNLASRLCDEAKANQIVVSRRVYGMVEPWVEGKPIDDLNLKGFNHPILAAEILSWREEVDNVVDAASAAARMKKNRSRRQGGQSEACPPCSSAPGRWLRRCARLRHCLTPTAAILPRRHAPEDLHFVSPPKNSEGAGKAGCPQHPRSCAKMHTGDRKVRRNTRPSLRNGFTAYSALSPETNSSCLHR